MFILPNIHVLKNHILLSICNIFANLGYMMNEKPEVLFEEESQSSRLSRKSKEAPFFPLGKHFYFLLFLFTIL